jgi:hypothetical protein
MKKGFFEKSPGNKSMMRLLAFLGFVLGSVVVAWGLVLLTRAVWAITAGKIEAVSVVGSLLMLVSSGLALAGGGQALKVVQQRSEVRESIAEGGRTNVVVESSNSSNPVDSGGGGL